MENNIIFHRIPIILHKSIVKPEISYDIVHTRFGNCLIALQDNKICDISFQKDENDTSLERLNKNWPEATLIHDPKSVKNIANKIFIDEKGDVEVILKGTDLQVDVWKELNRIKKGNTVSYERIADLVGKPKAVRAVASAIARNKIAYLIPCHRVISKSGRLNKYGGGVELKEKMLKYEKAIK